MEFYGECKDKALFIGHRRALSPFSLGGRVFLSQYLKFFKIYKIFLNVMFTFYVGSVSLEMPLLLADKISFFLGSVVMSFAVG